MATLPRSLRLANDFPTSGPPARPRPKRRWWLWTLLATVVVIGLLPLIIAQTPLLGVVVRSASDGLRGEVAIGSASFGWFSATSVRNVEIRDRDGETLLRLPSVTLDRSLASLLWNRTDLGRIRIEQPEAFVVVTPEGTNFEEVFQKFIRRPEPSLTCPAVSIELVEAAVTITDTTEDAEWHIEQVNATLQLARDWSEPMSAEVSAVLPTDRGDGQLSATASIVRSAVDDDVLISSGRVEITADAVPLELSQAFLQRAAPRVRLAGGLSSKCTLEWNTPEDGPLEAKATGELRGERLQLAAPQLQNDRLRLAAWQAPFTLTYQEGIVRVEELSLDCDLGRCQVQGPVAIDVAEFSTSRLLAALYQQDYQAEGHLDLARLAEQLPATLRIREGTEVTGGQLDLSLKHKTSAAGSHWDAVLNVDGLSAINDGQRIDWQKPIDFTLAAHDSQQGLVIEKCSCHSSFLEGEASGTIDQLTVSATYNLDELAAQLDQFVDLSDVELKGEGWTHIKWKRADDGQFSLVGEFQVHKLVLAQPNMQPWTEESLTIDADITGVYEDRSIRRIDSAAIQLKSGSDTARIVLAQPLQDLADDSAWPLEIDAEGQLATWLPRLEPVTGQLAGWTIAGNAKVASLATLSPTSVRFDETKATVHRLQVEHGAILIDEPNIELTVTGNFDREQKQLSVAEADIKSESLAVSIRELGCHLTEAGPEDLQGSASLSCDLGRLAAWLEDPRNPAAERLAGSLQGRLEFEVDGRASSAKFDGLVENLGLADEQGWIWQERNIEIVAQAQYLPAKQQLLINRLAVDGDIARIESSGQVADALGRRDLELRGKLDCDLEKLAVLLRPQLSRNVKIVADRQPRDFSVSMSLADPIATLKADGGVAWTGADAFGFPIGPAEVRGNLAEGLLQIDPLDISVSNGRLTTAPRVRLLPLPRMAAVDKGPLLEKVRITPEMCDRGLKFVLPILADATQTEGTFSVDLDDCQIPLGSPERGEPGPADADLSGRLTVNMVEIEAGPVISQLLVLVDGVRSVVTNTQRRAQNGQLPPARLRKESVVPFRMVEGRIYHRDLILDFDDVTIKTYGSVGLDQTLALMVEFTIPEKWSTGGPLRAALKGKAISVPFSGTLKQPKFDIEAALAKLTTDTIKGGVEGTLIEGLKGGLKGLFNK